MNEVHDLSTLISEDERGLDVSTLKSSDIDFSKLLRVDYVNWNDLSTVLRDDCALRIYDFVSDWKAGKYGNISLQDAIDDNLDKNFYIKKS